MKTKNIFLTLVLAMFTLVAFSQTQLITDAGSAHNFGANSTGAFTFAGNNQCAVCHTPHNAQPAVLPLWNRLASASVLTLHSEATDEAGSQSRLCLSCHDGTGKLDAYGGALGTTYVITGSANVGTDLENDHPISTAYPPATDTNFKDSATLNDVVLFSGKVECGSCHSMHSSETAINLIRTSAAQNLCIQCHNR